MWKEALVHPPGLLELRVQRALLEPVFEHLPEEQSQWPRRPL
jgi:hypothetical protein